MFLNIFLERIESRVTSELQSGRYNRLLRAAIVVFSFFFVLLFLYTAARRMRYPYDVEWIESGILVEVMRIAHGQPLYTAPTLDYIPFLYGPLYFYLAAALSKVTGLTFFFHASALHAGNMRKLHRHLCVRASRDAQTAGGRCECWPFRRLLSSL